MSSFQINTPNNGQWVNEPGIYSFPLVNDPSGGSFTVPPNNIYIATPGTNDSELHQIEHWLAGRGLPVGLQVNGWRIASLVYDYSRQTRESIVLDYNNRISLMQQEIQRMREQLIAHVPDAKDPKTGRKFRDDDEPL